MSTPLITVVVPAYNAAATIEQTLRSVCAQTMTDFEIVVVDDGSTDRTLDVVGGLDDARLSVVRRENGGPSAARNAGLQAANGRFVSVLDSDDLWLPRYLEVMIDALDGAPAAGFAYTDAWVYENADGRVRSKTAMAGQHPPSSAPTAAPTLFELLLDNNFVYTSVTAHRDVLERVGGYDERLWTAEDYELWLRLTAQGYGAVRAPETLAIHRERSGSLSSDLRRLVAGRCEVYRIVADEYDISDELRVRARANEKRWRATLQNIELDRHDAFVRRFLRHARTLGLHLIGRGEWLAHPPVEVLRTLSDSKTKLS